MERSLLVAVPLALLAFVPRPDRPAGRPAPAELGAAPSFELKEAAMTIEYKVETDEAVVRLGAESEQELAYVEVLGPEGEALLQLDSRDGRKRGLSGFEVELEEGSGARILELYREGPYDIRAVSVDGRAARGRATLSFELPPAPRLVFPFDGALNVPASELVLRWEPDRAAAGYRLVLEQDENDGLTVLLPPGSSSLRVPDGVLRPGTETQLEIAALGRNGNSTLVEVRFTTR